MNDERILLFSYGSGLASSMFSLRFNLSTDLQQNDLEKMCQISRENKKRLDQRTRKTPADYRSAVDRRSQQIAKVGEYTPQANTQCLFPNTFYLKEIDEACRRTYAQYNP
jgi:hydroxymethylglutaryl-CoA synthase